MTFLYYASDSFASRAKVLRDSLEKHHPNDKIVHINPQSTTQIGTYISGMAKERLIMALVLLEQGNDDVVVIGADCEIMSPMTELASCLRNNNVVIVPHAVSPVASRNYMAQIYRTGHANADLIGFKNCGETKDILEWLISVTEGNDPGAGIFYEQTWLSALPFLFDKIRILRHPGYNVGYWDIEQRMPMFHDDKWTVIDDHGNILPVRMVQYSGFVKGQPERMSKYAGKTATGDVLKLYQDYDARIDS